GHDRADRLYGRHPGPQDGGVGPAAAARHRRLLAAVLAGEGVRGVRGLLDVRDPGRRLWGPGPAGLLDVAGQYAAVLGQPAEGQRAQPDPDRGPAGLRRDRPRRDVLRTSRAAHSAPWSARPRSSRTSSTS